MNPADAEKPQDVKDLIRHSSILAARQQGGVDAPAEGGTKRGRISALAGLLRKEDVLLVGVCLLMSGGFFLLAVMNFYWAGSFLSTDSLFFTTVSMLMAGIFIIYPLTWLHANGLLKNPFAADPAAEALVDNTPVHFEGSTQLFLTILGALLVLTVVEVILAYFQVNLVLMLTILVGLSLLKAFLIMAYFMHLRFERRTLVLTLIPMLVICVCLLFVFFPDSRRSSQLRYRFESSTQVAEPAAAAEH
ncbi:MAG TPA: cytochrome C oxidase subunit IV family protein [Pyrinomonadaceae bacterium]|jgi:cytochrome c oxidase subunit 4